MGFTHVEKIKKIHERSNLLRHCQLQKNDTPTFVKSVNIITCTFSGDLCHTI